MIDVFSNTLRPKKHGWKDVNTTCGGGCQIVSPFQPRVGETAADRMVLCAAATGKHTGPGSRFSQGDTTRHTTTTCIQPAARGPIWSRKVLFSQVECKHTKINQPPKKQMMGQKT